MTYWLNPALTDHQRQIAKAEFAIAHGYRTDFYQAELDRLTAGTAAETVTPAPSADRQTDRSDHEGDA